MGATPTWQLRQHTQAKFTPRHLVASYMQTCCEQSANVSNTTWAKVPTILNCSCLQRCSNAGMHQTSWLLPRLLQYRRSASLCFLNFGQTTILINSHVTNHGIVRLKANTTLLGSTDFQNRPPCFKHVHIMVCVSA